jgi:hypothetical protein
MYRAIDKKTGNVVTGWLVEYAGVYQIYSKPTKDDVIECGFRTHKVHPSSVAMQTGVKDRNDTMIYGSIEIDGKMTSGGDEVLRQIKDGASARYPIRWYDDMQGWGGLDQYDGWTYEITGSQWKGDVS